MAYFIGRLGPVAAPPHPAAAAPGPDRLVLQGFLPTGRGVEPIAARPTTHVYKATPTLLRLGRKTYRKMTV